MTTTTRPNPALRGLGRLPSWRNLGASVLNVLTDPQRRAFHAWVIVAALVLHLSLHYATYVPALREPLGSLPYFRLHILHEAEFLLIIAYTGVVFGTRGGLIAIAITAATSVPFILTPYIFGRAPRVDEIRDMGLQVVLILAMGYLIVILHQAGERRRKMDHEMNVLRESEQLKDRFLSLASHELRTPLASIHGFSELLLQRSVTVEQQRLWLERIHAQSGRLAGLAADLLDVSRIQGGRLVVANERVVLDEVVRDSVEWAGVGSRQLPVRLEIPDGLPLVQADRARLTQVVANLIENAVKYSPKGGEIRVFARSATDGRVEICVQDQGLGIAEGSQKDLFTPFQRVQTAENAGIPGSGLGLYIVKCFTEAMGGKVWLESHVNQGSSFWISLSAWDSTVPAETVPA